MKKLLSIFAAAVVLFGFASCSGDMHDETAIDMTQLYLRGDMNAWGATPLSQNEDGTWGVKFTASLTTHQFAIATNDGSWSIAYRMTELNGSKCAEYTEDDVAKSSVKKLYHGGGMGNATVPTEVGTDYTLTIVPQLGYLEVSFSKGVTPPTLSVVTGSENKKMDLTGAGTYTYKFTADDTSFTFKVFDGENNYGTTKDSVALKETIALSTANDSKALVITTVKDTGYIITVKISEDNEYSVLIKNDYVPVYLAGGAPLTWDIGKDNAIEAKIVAETAECKDYYYSFKAESASLDFKVALKNSWDDAYSNCEANDGEVETTLDAAPVEFTHANKKNARITGLTVGNDYTIVINTSSGKPKVSIVSGKDVIFAIGNDDFGKWSWESPIMLNPVAKGEWKYEFTATKADAEFKFQTTCGGWHDADTWNAKQEITVGGNYVAMENGPGGSNTTAKLTVGNKYILSVKNIDGKYNVKISNAE